MSPDAYFEMSRVQSRHWWYAARRDILRSQLHALALPANSSILEIGSGTGANLELLAEFGVVTALEMSAAAIRLASDLPVVRSKGIRLLSGSCPSQLSQLKQSFDVICLLDVLEHIEQDVASLRALSPLISPGGRLLVTVPAYQWLWGPHDEQMHHRRRYNRESLRDILATSGWKLEKISHFNTLLFPLAVAARCIERITGSNATGVQVPPEPVNALLRSIFSFERRLLSRVSFPYGLSIFAIASPVSNQTS